MDLAGACSPGITTHLPLHLPQVLLHCRTELLLLGIATLRARTARQREGQTAPTSLGFSASLCSALNPVTVAMRLDRVHAVHRLACFVAMPLRIRRRQRQEARMRDPAQEIRIQRQNHIRILQLVLRVRITAKRRLRGRHRRIAIHRLPLHQLRRGYFACTCFHCAASVGDVIVSLRK